MKIETAYNFEDIENLFFIQLGLKPLEFNKKPIPESYLNEELFQFLKSIKLLLTIQNFPKIFTPVNPLVTSSWLIIDGKVIYETEKAEIFLKNWVVSFYFFSPLEINIHIDYRHPNADQEELGGRLEFFKGFDLFKIYKGESESLFELDRNGLFIKKSNKNRERYFFINQSFIHEIRN